jgi:photosystem II stability/assembly factor-like uncharacterized protein
MLSKKRKHSVKSLITKTRSYRLLKRPDYQKAVSALLTLFLLFQINGASAAPTPDWYNTSWDYRRAITIDNTGDGLSDYQVKFELTTGSFDYSKASSTGADIRFTDKDGTTLIDYWIEEWDDTATSTIWVEVPDISASSTKTIYMYYGTAEASSASNGKNTFQLFDDFDDRWLVDVGNPGEHPIIKNNKVYMPANGLYIIDLNTGEVLHHYLSGNWYYAAPVIDNSGFIHIYSGDTGYIQKVNESTGAVDSISIGNVDFESLTYDSVNDRLIVMATGGLKAINTSDYSVQWTNTDVTVNSAQYAQSAVPLIVDNYVYARSNSDGILYKINLNTGATVASVALAGNGLRYATLIYDSDNDYIYAFEHSECNVYARRASDLKGGWTKNLGEKTLYEIMRSSMYHANKLIVPVKELASPYRAKLYALDVTNNGDILWTNPTAYDNRADLINGVLDDNYVYITTFDYEDGSYHKLLVINVNDGTLYKTYEQASNSSCSSLIASGGKVVLGLWDTKQAQMIPIRSAGDSLDMLFKVDQYRTGYLGTRLSGSFLDDPNTGWTNPGNFDIQDGSLKKYAAYTNQFWRGITMSDTGQYQTAVVDGGNIYVSTDYGNTWIQKGSSRNWRGIAMSDTGQYQTAVVGGGQIYVSTDSGNTWTQKGTSQSWSGITMSSDGVHQIAVVGGDDGGYIYVSDDSGESWSPKDDVRYWSGVAMSSDGVHQTAVVGGNDWGYIYVSNNSGESWSPKDDVRCWSGVAMSSDGVHQTAVVGGDDGGYIYVSDDSGESWSPKDDVCCWSGVAMSSDGIHQTAVVWGGYIYVSSDSGANWTEYTGVGTKSWFSVAMSSTGQYQTAVVYGGQIYTSSNYGNNWNLGGNSYAYPFISTDTFAYPLAVEAKTKIGSDWSS